VMSKQYPQYSAKPWRPSAWYSFFPTTWPSAVNTQQSTIAVA